MRTINTPRLILEPQTALHAEAMFAVLSDPAIYAFENAPPESLEWLRARYRRLESRQSADGSQVWLNWVLLLSPDTLIGYVQATVEQFGTALIAYELGSAWWGRGLGSEAVTAMIEELFNSYAVTRLAAVYKTANFRSARLLRRLGFGEARPDFVSGIEVGDDERMMVRERF